MILCVLDVTSLWIKIRIIKKTWTFLHTNRPEFLKNCTIKEGCQIGYQWQNANKVYILENFTWRLCYQSLSQNDLNCFKNRLGTCGFADRQFVLYKQSWEVLFLLKEDYCPIPSWEIRDVYGHFHEWTKSCIFQKTIFYISFTDNPFNVKFASKALQKHKLSINLVLLNIIWEC